MKEFTKSDLKNGMIVESRNGEKFIVIDEKLLSITDGHNKLSGYNEDLTVKRITETEDIKEFDIMKIYDQVYSLNFEAKPLKLLWERKETKEVTIREILFRGKRKTNGKWVYGLLAGIFENDNTALIRVLDKDKPIHHDYYDYLVDLKTVEQYTGRTDKNNKKVFDGDIIKISGSTSCYAKVTYSEYSASYWAENKNLEYYSELSSLKSSFIKVVGNVIDNICIKI